MPDMPNSLLSPLWQMPPVAPGGMLGEMDPMELMRRAALMRGPLTMASSNDEMDRIDAGWLRELQREPPAEPSPGPAPPLQVEPEADEQKSLWRRAIDFFGQGAQNLTESYNDALSDNTRGAVLPIRRDPQSGDYSLAWPRLLDVINTLPSVAPTGGITLGAGAMAGRAKKIAGAVDAGLDLSTEARMARAREMGFDTTPYYHGTAGDFSSYQHGVAKTTADADTPGFHFTRSPEVASEYAQEAGEVAAWKAREAAHLKDDMGRFDDMLAEMGLGKKSTKKRTPKKAADLPAPNVQKVLLGLKKPYVAKSGSDVGMGDVWDQAKIDSLIAEGYDGIVFKSGSGAAEEVVVLDPTRIRSAHAKFDPARIGSADLLASRAAPGIAMGQPPRMTEDEYWAMLAAGRT